MVTDLIPASPTPLTVAHKDIDKPGTLFFKPDLSVSLKNSSKINQSHEILFLIKNFQNPFHQFLVHILSHLYLTTAPNIEDKE